MSCVVMVVEEQPLGSLNFKTFPWNHIPTSSQEQCIIKWKCMYIFICTCTFKRSDFSVSICSFSFSWPSTLSSFSPCFSTFPYTHNSPFLSNIWINLSSCCVSYLTTPLHHVTGEAGLTRLVRSLLTWQLN